MWIDCIKFGSRMICKCDEELHRCSRRKMLFYVPEEMAEPMKEKLIDSESYVFVTRDLQTIFDVYMFNIHKLLPVFAIVMKVQCRVSALQFCFLHFQLV